MTNKFPEAFDGENAICKKTLVKTGEVRQMKERSKKIRKVTLNPTKITKLNSSTTQIAESGILVEKIEVTSEFGDEYVIEIGSICQSAEEDSKLHIVNKIIKTKNKAQSDVDVFVLEVKTIKMHCDTDTGDLKLGNH